MPKWEISAIIIFPKTQTEGSAGMPRPVIVVHYHELWLKGGNRNFFVGKLLLALRRSLGQFPIARIRRPGDRLVIELGENAPVDDVVAQLERIPGIAYFAV